MGKRIPDKSGIKQRFHNQKYQITTYEGSDFFIRTDNWEQDTVLIKDVFIQDVYKLKELKELIPIKVVVDIGGHIGTFGRLVKKIVPDCQVFAYECCPENFGPLRKNSEPHGRRSCREEGKTSYSK